jgi:hypothetical protein
MTRYLCPDCEDGMTTLNDDLSCEFCGGSYTWRKKEIIKIEEEIEEINKKMDENFERLRRLL